jgi:electron transfer flavoprotein alpha subunit
LDTLNDGKEKTGKMLKTTADNAEKALAETSNSTVIQCEGTKIVSEFKLIKGSDKVELDLDGFFISDTYMPEDNNAPDRILAIVTELRAIVMEMFAAKSKVLEDNADSCRESIISTGRTEDGRQILTRMVNGKAVPMTGDTIKVQDAIDTLYFYKAVYPMLVAKEYSNKVVTSSGKKYLNGAVLYCEDGCVKFDNLSKFNAEVQQVVSDMIGYFRLAK